MFGPGPQFLPFRMSGGGGGGVGKNFGSLGGGGGGGYGFYDGYGGYSGGEGSQGISSFGLGLPNVVRDFSSSWGSGRLGITDYDMSSNFGVENNIGLTCCNVAGVSPAFLHSLTLDAGITPRPSLGKVTQYPFKVKIPKKYQKYKGTKGGKTSLVQLSGGY